ncbi:DEKNAAC101720 [Brettanomyces naardenensis]|uniref:DEKNAAC101720 n=1 Tax=Brettanomyces naardenensis TaxID=13370 RepID=A0A448YIN6_BRENA|nr:DEKNAAC101720 [Brettanomyces naardenensis]
MRVPFSSPRYRPRIRRFLLGLVFLTLIYYLWPVDRIEKISETLGDEVALESKLEIKQKSRSVDATSELYQPIAGPVKGSFNPDKNDIEVPQVIKPGMIDEALRRLSLKPLKQGKFQKSYASPQGVVSGTVSGQGYSTMNKLKAYAGNLVGTFKESKNCEDISYEPDEDTADDEIQYTDAIPLKDDDLMKELLAYLKSSGYSKTIQGLNLKTMKMKDWYTFSGSAIWLPDEGFYLLVRRVMYAPLKRTVPTVSFVGMQAFDINWKELKGKRVRYLGVTETEADSALRQFSLLDRSSRRRGKVLDQISIKFPTFMDIDFDVKNRENLLGPEDPRIVFKETESGPSEPVVVFNMYSSSKRRSMYAAFPFRKPRRGNPHTVSTLQFIHSGSSSLTISAIEKNWTPFFEDPKHAESISFLYGLDPLVIFRCRLDNGKCEKVQDDEYGTGMIVKRKIALRGGTNLVSVPDEVVNLIPEVKKNPGHQVRLWVAFAKTHGWACGCGSATYRPTMYVLAKVDGVYRIDLMTENMDFGIDVPSFYGDYTQCDTSPNVLTPNSIPFWNVTIPAEKQKSNSIHYSDYMGLTISEADRTVKVLFLKNVLNYILGIYEDGSGRQLLLDDTSDVAARTRNVERCVLERSLAYCKSYALSH